MLVNCCVFDRNRVDQTGQARLGVDGTTCAASARQGYLGNDDSQADRQAVQNMNSSFR